MSKQNEIDEAKPSEPVSRPNHDDASTTSDVLLLNDSCESPKLRSECFEAESTVLAPSLVAEDSGREPNLPAGEPSAEAQPQKPQEAVSGRDIEWGEAEAKIRPSPVLLSKFILGFCKKAWQILSILAISGIVSLVVLMLIVFFFGRQLVTAADAELKKHPYIAFPLKDFADPLFEGSENSRKIYFNAGKDLANAWLQYGLGYSNVQHAHYGEPHRNRKIVESPEYLFVRTLKQVAQLKETKTDAMLILTYYGLGLSRLAKDGTTILAGDTFEKAEQLALKELGPRSFFVAELDRRIAEENLLKDLHFSKAEKWAEKALKIDSNAGDLGKIPALHDRKLLTRIAFLRGNSADADNRWSEELAQARIAYGDNSLLYANAVILHANYLLNQKSYLRSLEDTDSAFKILQAYSVRKKSWLDIPHPNLDLFGMNFLAESDWENSRAYTNFLEVIGASRRAILVDQNSPPSSREKLRQLDKEYLSWMEKVCDAKKSSVLFNLLVKIADDYAFSRDYASADFYYKRALMLGAKANMLSMPLKRQTKEKEIRANPASNYLICMAKTVHNCFLRGELKEGCVISRNLLKYLDPFDNWTARRSESAVQELIYAFGAVPPSKHSAEFKKLQSSLIDMLEFKRLTYSYGTYDKAILIAELHELQGNFIAAERSYREALAIAPDDTRYLGALAAFLEKQGRLEEAGRLYERGEAIVYQHERPKHPSDITVVSDSRLSAIMSTSLDKSFTYDKIDIGWVPVVQDSLLLNNKTSRQLGERYSIIDLRPWISDFRNDSKKPLSTTEKKSALPGVVYDTVAARADLSSLSKEKLREAKKRFAWIELCYRPSEVLREKLPDIKVNWFSRSPRSLRDLKPVRFLIISPEDAAAMKKMLGRDLSKKTDVEVKI
ncbi:MAG: hypothetical protein K2X77_05150 [Candidatus Obscuribacterales bacterium]|nr:hypothetical protein [Candidatus Obscuribacterales bacterium]